MQLICPTARGFAVFAIGNLRNRKRLGFFLASRLHLRSAEEEEISYRQNTIFLRTFDPFR